MQYFYKLKIVHFYIRIYHERLSVRLHEGLRITYYYIIFSDLFYMTFK